MVYEQKFRNSGGPRTASSEWYSPAVILGCIGNCSVVGSVRPLGHVLLVWRTVFTDIGSRLPLHVRFSYCDLCGTHVEKKKKIEMLIQSGPVEHGLSVAAAVHLTE